MEAGAQDYLEKNAIMPKQRVNLLPTMLENVICRINRKRGVAFSNVPVHLGCFVAKWRKRPPGLKSPPDDPMEAEGTSAQPWKSGASAPRQRTGDRGFKPRWSFLLAE